jgi:hypothetical protein
VADTIRSGITNIDFFTPRPDILAYGAQQDAIKQPDSSTLVTSGTSRAYRRIHMLLWTNVPGSFCMMLLLLRHSGMLHVQILQSP